jgi:hypothetical protein
MAHTRSSAQLLLFFLFLSVTAIAQKASSLPRSVPEAEGVASDDIVKFLDATGKSKTEFHSFMLLRHGKVIAEGWWNPYHPDLKHTLYFLQQKFYSDCRWICCYGKEAFFER